MVRFMTKISIVDRVSPRGRSRPPTPVGGDFLRSSLRDDRAQCNLLLRDVALL